MKKRGNRFNGIIRLIAVLCALVLVIQTVPFQTAVTVSSYASETSEEEEKKRQEEEEKKRQEEEEKKRQEEEEKKRQEEEEKKRQEEEEKKRQEEEEKKKQEEEEKKKQEEEEKKRQEEEEKKKQEEEEKKKQEEEEKKKQEEEEKKRQEEEEKKKQEEEEEEKQEEEEKKEQQEKQEEAKKDSENTSSGETNRRDESADGSSGENGKETSEEQDKSEESDRAKSDEQKTESKKDTKEKQDTATSPDQNKDSSKENLAKDEGTDQKTVDSITAEPVEETIKEDAKKAADTLTDDALEIHKGSDKVTEVTVKDEAVTLHAKVDLEDTTGLSYAWSVKAASGSSASTDAVHLEGENNDEVKITSVTGKKGGKLSLVLKVQDGDKTAEKTIELTVYTKYAVDKIELSKSVKGADSDDKLDGSEKKASVTDTLHASLRFEDNASSEDKEEGKYEFKWEKKDGDSFNGAPGTNNSSSYELEKEGTYRVTVSRKGDYREDYTQHSDEITVTKIPVEIIWPDAERVYDAKSNSIEYQATGQVRRTDADVELDDVKLPEAIDLRLTDESTADAGTYNNVKVPTDDFTDLEEKYDIKSSTVGEITITAKKIEAEVSIWGKNFDNTTDVEAAKDGEKLSVAWNNLDSALSDIEDSLKLQVNGTDIEASDLQYKYANDDERERNSEADTEVDVVLKGGGSENIYTVSGDSIKPGNYSVSVTYSKAVIRKVEFENTASVDETKSVANNKKIYVKESPASLVAAEGYTIAGELGEPGAEYSQTADVAVGENGGIVYYAKNGDGDIAKDAISDVFIDNTAPTVELSDIKKASNTEYINKYRVTDTGAGIEEVKVLIADNIVSYPDGGEWTTITLPESTDGEAARDFEFEVKVPAYGYVNIYAADKLENKSDSNTNNHMVIYENTPPSVDVECSTMSDPTKKKEISISVDDGEESIGAKSVSIQLLDSEGNAVDSALTLDGDLPDGFKFENGTYSRTEENIPESLKSAEDFRNFTANFLINGENQQLTGDCKLVVTATDYLANTSDAKEWALVFDNKVPDVAISLDNGDKNHTYDGVEYYNAAKGEGLKITITDDYLNYKDGEGKSGEYSAVIYDAEKTEIDRKDLDLATVEDKTAEIIFTPEELKKYGNGKITVKVTAKDYAGNVNDNIEQNQYSFVLDTLSPKITASRTEPEYGGKDNATGCLFYNDTFTTTLTIVEANMGEDSLNGAYNGEVSGKLKIEKSSAQGEYSVVYNAKENGKYGTLTISGEDYAGNLLEKDDAFIAESTDADEWAEKTAGTFETVHAREIAKKVLVVTVDYTELDDAHIDEFKAYYNKDITAVLKVTYEKSTDVVPEEDLKEIKYALVKMPDEGDVQWSDFGKNNSVSVGPIKAEKKYNGEYQIRVSGTNKAGIPIKVQEKSPKSDETLGIVDTSDGEYEPQYTLVLDTVSPEAEININDNESARNSLNSEYGNRFYFNKRHEATIDIKEKNLKFYTGDKNEVSESRLKVAYAEKEPDEYEDASKVEFSSKDFKYAVERKSETASIEFNREGEITKFDFNITNDGVIQYLIDGQDLAGNSLIIKHNMYYPDAGKSDCSYPIVTDTELLDMHVTVLTINGAVSESNREEKAYEMGSDGSVRINDRYKKANQARIIAELDDSTKEKTPYWLHFTVIERNDSEEEKECTSKETKVKNILSQNVEESIRSRVIRVEDFYAEDLSGNRVGSTEDKTQLLKTAEIFLDPNMPEVAINDDQAPMITIRPVDSSKKKYGIEGKPLYNSDVKLDVTVTDPYGPKEPGSKSHGSTGLKSIRYELSNHENTLDDALSVDKELFTFNEKVSDTDSNLVFKQEWTGEQAIPINKDKANYNYLDFTVKAVDNAGNESIAHYYFGIDVTPPEITLSYENNNLKNNYYFNKGRTATIKVTERNFDPDECEIRVTGKKYGSLVSKAGEYTESTWERGEDAKDVRDDNGDNVTHVKTITFNNDGVYTLTIATGNKNNTIIDHAGNEGTLQIGDSRAPFEFVIDQTTPNASIKMGSTESFVKPDKEDGKYYYRAGNCGIVVTFDDNGQEFGMQGSGVSYSVRIKGEKDDVKRELELEKFSFDDIKANKTKYRRAQQIRFTSEQLAQGENRLLHDGPFTITVTAVDPAGNKASKDYFIKNSRGCEFNSDNYSGKFILDTVRPVVTSISTSSAVAKADRKYSQITDNKVYSDTKSVYYNTNVKVRLVVKDEFTRNSLFKGTMSRDGDGKTPSVNAEISSKDNNTYAVYTLTGDHQYKDLILKGADKAGNKLQLIAGGYSHSDVDALYQDSDDSKAGQVHLKNGKVIDLTAPEAWIKYESTDKANMYKEGADKEKVRAYYNEPVDIRISFSDNYQLDGKKLFAGEKGVDKALNFQSTSSKYTVPTIRISEDSRKRFTAYGTDRALNQTRVHEMNPLTDTKKDVTYVGGEKGISAGAFNKDLTSQKPYAPKYQIIVDRTAPTFTMVVKSEKSARQQLQDGRYFFNQGYTATFTVDETNFDASKISLRRGSVTDNGSHYNSQSEKITVKNKDAALHFKEKSLSDEMNRDGVYRYAIFGSDKAGNALVPSSNDNLDGTSTSVINTKYEQERGSKEKEANTSVHIIVDKVAPKGSLEVKTGNQDIYKIDVDGNVTFAEPYRKETTASVRIKVDENVERTPVNIAYKIESTSSSDSKTVSNTQYKYNNSVTTTQSGQQAFRVVEYTFTDLAGNARTYKSDNQIYLDKAAPNIDKIAPTISIVAHAKSGTAGYVDGQPLFKSDVPLSIHVSDPDSGKSSSGLAEITYKLTDGGSASGSGELHKKNTQKFDKNYKDQKLDYSMSRTVTVDGQKHNNNNIEITVTAFDNAGNKREAKYHFGIDTTKPTVRVTYDNNSALNGEFFKADRTATVAVTERNFEPSKFHITTESVASIGGWSHSRNGGNGDKDVWTARVTYARDGNYTLKVSGEDLLGNPATEIRYEGTAPQKFTIDKTAPAVTVTYDNNDVANEKYYKAARTATIDINDVNFAGQNDIVVEASGGGSAPAVSFAGNTATLHFAEDGIYVFNGTVTDKAGNITTIPVQTEFVVDTKAPVLRFDNNRPFKVVSAADETKSDYPITNQFFKDDVFAPGMTVLDTNCSTAPADAVLQIDGTKEAHHFLGTIGALDKDGKQFRVSLSSTDFKVEKSSDDVYHVTAYAVDLAGNKSEVVEFDFSLNRFGSNFVTADDYTKAYIREQYYHNTTDKDLLIHEYNTNRLKKDSEKIELIMNGNTTSRRELVRGKDYELKEDTAAGSTKGGRIYLYTIKNSVFEEEGDYSFSITSVDETGHTNSTSEIHTGQRGKDGKLTVSTFPIDFVVDKTPPVNELAGVSSQVKQSFNKNSLAVEIHPEDAQTAVEQVEIRRWEAKTDLLGNPVVPQENEAPVEIVTYAYYAEGERPADTGTEFYKDLAEYADSNDKIVINYDMKEKKDWQVVEIITTDSAGNKSVDIRAGGQDGLNESRREFLVTTDLFARLVNSMAVRIGVVGVAALLILLIVILKRRKQEAGQ